MKHKYLSTCLLNLIWVVIMNGQNITFSIANAQLTNAGPHGSIEFDVDIAASSTFTLGSGQLYFNYNTDAFGSNAWGGGNIIITVPANYLLDQRDNVINTVPVYSLPPSVEDNISSRVSIAFLQSLKGACINPNVGTAPASLFHVRFDYINGGSSYPHNICFESNQPFDDQTFTYCGPFDVCNFQTANCQTHPGTRLLNDFFDCSALVLPVELLSFRARALEESILLTWATATEEGFDGFFLEKSLDGREFWPLVWVAGKGGTLQANYSYEDDDVAPEINHYYRLKMVDLDGSFEYSDIRSAKIAGETAVRIYPNPAKEKLFIAIAQFNPGAALVQLTDGTGRLVLSQSYQLDEGANSLIIPLPELPMGLYTCEVRLDQKVFSEKVVVVQ